MIALPYPGNDVVHGLWVGLGLLAALIWYGLEKRRLRLRDDRLWVLAGMAVAFGAIGARVLTWPQAGPSGYPSLAQWWVEGNRSILAGLVGAWFGVWLGKRLTGYRADTGELFAPAVALAVAIGRVGCLLTENPGTSTGGDWGMVLTPEQALRLGGVADVGLRPAAALACAAGARRAVSALRGGLRPVSVLGRVRAGQSRAVARAQWPAVVSTGRLAAADPVGGSRRPIGPAPRRHARLTEKKAAGCFAVRPAWVTIGR